MRRLPDERSAASLLRRGRLDPVLLAALADRLAGFFAEAPPAPDCGTAEALAFNVDENFAQTEAFVPELVDRATFEEVRAFQETALARAAPFAQRLAEGRVREGHGDLRLEHAYFVTGGDAGGSPTPLVIDCIEFNRRLRCGDVAGEVAFLAMELEAARRPDLAAGFLARFAEASDDFGLYEVLDFYLSYRAWVRGKVAGFVARDPAADFPTRTRKRDEARRVFALARACAGRPLDRPFLLVIGGMIGSGKSTLAATLGGELAVPVIGSDRTRKALAGLPLTERAPPGLYTPENVERTYQELFRRAGRVLGAGRSVILDATFSKRRWRWTAAALAEACGADLVVLEARCTNPDILRRRLRDRETAASLSDAGLSELEPLQRAYEPPANDLGGPGRSAEPAPALVVETSGPPEAAATEAVLGLRRLGILPARERAAS
jgi:predicted kinase